MATSESFPVISSFRKFGHRGLGRFERRESAYCAPVVLGQGNIGKVKIDCQFLFDKAKWGVMGPHETPAGILYVDIHFHQPEDCRLRSANVVITLDDGVPNDGGIASTYLQFQGGPFHTRFTGQFGPRDMCGQRTAKEIQKKQHLTPHLSVLGNAFGGLGVDTDETFQRASRWMFSGHSVSNNNGVINQLAWVLDANELEGGRSFHSNTFKTAFAISHNGRQFSISVDVDGKLEKLTHRLQRNMKGYFKRRKNGQQDNAAAMVDFGSSYRWHRSLDEIANSLNLEMQHQNQALVPVQIPDPMSAQFLEEIRPSAIPAPSITSQQTSSMATSEGHGQTPAVQAAETLFLEGSQTQQSSSIAELAHVSGLYGARSLFPSSARDQHRGLQQQQQRIRKETPRRTSFQEDSLESVTSSTTLVGEVGERDDASIQNESKPSLQAAAILNSVQNRPVDPEIAAWILVNPLFVTLIHFVAYVSGVYRKVVGPKEPEGSEEPRKTVDRANRRRKTSVSFHVENDGKNIEK